MKILSEIESKLKNEHIYFINENQVLDEQKSFLKEYFIQKVSPALMTIIVRENSGQDFSDNLLTTISTQDGLENLAAVSFVDCDKCGIPDTYIVSSYISFGYFGWIILIATFFIFLNN